MDVRIVNIQAEHVETLAVLQNVIFNVVTLLVRENQYYPR